ncbi:hypothetical protein ACOBR2_07770 [Telmatobacter bradus]|uniref:hypothetical protein n=1 Tax=Telmatobacter bradus TaxID=474953 RepID=UPI003B439DD6
MIPVQKVKKPVVFEREVGIPGSAWLSRNRSSKSRPPAHWNKVKSELKKGFDDLCAYAAMYVSNDGTVDHYLSCNTHRDLVYVWDNYRFASGEMNSCKQNADDSILDPYEVEQGWFEILLPSLQMRVTEAVPEDFRKRAKYTLKRLKLENGAQVIRWRRSWYAMYESGELTLQGLQRVAPLIAEAVKKESKKHK